MPARAIECFVVDQLMAHVSDAGALSRQVANEGLVAIVRKHIVRITLHARSVEIVLRNLQPRNSTPAADSETTTIDVPIRLKLRGGEKTIIAAENEEKDSEPRPSPGLIRSIVRARKWRKLIESGNAQSVEQIAQINKCAKSYARFMLEVSFLAPDIVDRILSGKQPRLLTVRRLFASGVPLSWREQRLRFNIDNHS